MITNINEYEAETAFERFALDRYLPLTAQASGSYIDIRPLIDGGKKRYTERGEPHSSQSGGQPTCSFLAIGVWSSLEGARSYDRACAGETRYKTPAESQALAN